MTTAVPSMWMGPDNVEARAGYGRAKEAGLNELRARIFGSFASFKNCWAYRSSVAKFYGCSTRTVQRVITQTKHLGMLEVHRSKQGERPPNWPRDLPAPDCGFSHRMVVGRGEAPRVARQMIESARARMLAKLATQPNKADRSSIPRGEPRAPVGRHNARPHFQRKFTPEELENELARVPREPDKPPN